VSRSKTSSRRTGPEGETQAGGSGQPASDRRTEAFLIVVSGPSGAGKTTLVGKMLERVPQLRRSVSVTTRPPRTDEIDGESYRFVDEDRFRRLRENDLAEWAEVHGQFYGTPKRPVEEALEEGFDIVLNIDVQGARQMKKSFPDAVMVFILPPSFGELERRIRKRSADLSQDIEKRLENARVELRALPEFDFVVVNDELRDAVDELGAIVVSERCRRKRYARSFLDGFR
jgi:guanylate kinase